MRSQRLAASTGAAYVLAVLVGNELASAGTGSADDGAAVLADLQRPRSTVNVIGTVLEVLGTALLIVFVGYLYRVLRRAEGSVGWWAAPAFGAGLITVAVKLASAGPVLAGRLRADELTPDLARTLDDLNGAAFVISGFTFGIFVLTAAAAALSGRVLPRWLAIAGLVTGVLGIAAGTAGVLDPAGYVPVPFLLGLAWVLGVSGILAVRSSRPGTAARIQDAVPAGASATA
ncbi:MAG: hypothetical protein JWQ99_3866 [Blastococcus sp.]|jgi:hypothetical protein|nr:hypothetical protein [Blastococcus sp.]